MGICSFPRLTELKWLRMGGKQGGAVAEGLALGCAISSAWHCHPRPRCCSSTAAGGLQSPFSDRFNTKGLLSPRAASQIAGHCPVLPSNALLDWEQRLECGSWALEPPRRDPIERESSSAAAGG